MSNKPVKETKPIHTKPMTPIISNSSEKKPQFETNAKYFTICVYGLIFVALATLIIISIVNWQNTCAIFNTTLKTLTPFVIAFFIAYILNPLVKRIDRLYQRLIFKDKFTSGRKYLSIATTYVIVLSFITITLLYITPELLKTVKDIDNTYSSISIAEIETKITNLLNELEDKFPSLDIKIIEDKVNDFIPDLFSYCTTLLTNLLSISFSIVKTFINVLLSIVISCYMLADKNTLRHNFKRVLYALFPSPKANYIVETLKECNTIFSSFIIGKSIDSLIIGVICFVVMTLLKLDYAILLSVIVGITNMIPYFGPFIGAIPGIIIYLFINPVEALIFGIMIFALQQFDGLYLGPKILGESTGLTPLWVIFGITVGGASAGVIGMFLGVPITAVVAYLLNKYINTRLEHKKVKI